MLPTFNSRFNNIQQSIVNLDQEQLKHFVFLTFCRARIFLVRVSELYNTHSVLRAIRVVQNVESSKLYTVCNVVMTNFISIGYVCIYLLNLVSTLTFTLKIDPWGRRGAHDRTCSGCPGGILTKHTLIRPRS